MAKTEPLYMSCSRFKPVSNAEADPKAKPVFVPSIKPVPMPCSKPVPELEPEATHVTEPEPEAMPVAELTGLLPGPQAGIIVLGDMPKCVRGFIYLGALDFELCIVPAIYSVCLCLV